MARSRQQLERHVGTAMLEAGVVIAVALIISLACIGDTYC